MISTDITRTIGTAVDRAALATSRDAAVCTVMAAAQDMSVDRCTTADLRDSSFAGGHVWLRPAAVDALVPTTTGHPAWSPPT